MTVGEKVITGDWDGKPIWRLRTVAEVLANEIFINEQKRKETNGNN